MNALAHEKSPYLLQHAENPVDWLPWGEAAFARARAEQKPLFLSIGYSTCHWCHVMAHECFEDQAVAKLLNAHFIPVKVDREERPDVDRVYMTYVQAVSGHGGWPLNVWLTPDLKPFYGGTYFPPEDREGRPGLRSLLTAIAQGWANTRDQLLGEAERVIGLLREHFGPGGRPGRAADPEPAAATPAPLVEAAGKAFEHGFQHFYEAFDPTHAGFGGAPKFPRASNLNFLFRVAALQGPSSELGAEAIKMAAATLEAMSRGGLHDHVGGGFHRYSVDDRWFLPHFEKMLYDQAQIALNTLEARQATGDERFGWVARDIFDYVRRDLTSPAGAFFTAEDADSLQAAGAKEHVEGAFYVWTHEEFSAAAGEDAPLLAAHFGVAVEGNVPAQIDPHGEFKGRNVLAQRRPLLETAQALGLDPQVASDRILRGMERLRTARSVRPRPLRDDKVLAANNALMISALARAHQVLGSTAAEDYLDRARRAAAFLQQELYDADHGVLYRVWRGTRGTIEAFAEDYAFLIQGLIDLYEASFEVRWLRWAEALQGAMDERFLDAAGGGYYNSAAADASVILRLKEDYDGAEPAPGSVAAMNLFRLAAMLHRPDLRERGRAVIESLRPQWERAPHALPQLLCALELALEPPRHAVIAGDPANADFQALAAVLHEKLGPRRVLLGLDGGEAQAWLAQRAPWLAEMRPIDGRATVYLCEEYTCHAPVSDPAALRQRLST